MQHYAGLDVAAVKTSLCVVDDQGRVLHETSIDTDPTAIAAALHPWRKTLACVGHEAGQFSHWLQRGLTALKLPAQCLETRHTRDALKAQQQDRPRRRAGDRPAGIGLST